MNAKNRFTLIAATAITFLISGCDKAEAPPAQQQAIPAPAPTLKLQDRLTQLMSPDMLGATPAYFEQIAGVPYKVDPDSRMREYRIEGCTVKIYHQGESISGITLALSEQCTFQIDPRLIETSTPAHQLVFGDFYNAGDAVFYADCLGSCGNAANYSIYMQVLGSSRATQDLALELEAVMVEDDVLRAANQWEKFMTQKKGEDWVMNARFNCADPYADPYNEAAQNYFRKVKPSHITVGRTRWSFSNADCHEK